MLDRLEVFAMEQLLRLHQIFHRRYIAGDRAQLLEGVVDLLFRHCGGPIRDDGLHFLLVLTTRLTGDEPLIAPQLRLAHYVAQALPDVLCGANAKPWRDPAVLSTHQRALAPDSVNAAELIMNRGMDLAYRHRLHHRDVDMLTIALSIPHVQRQHGRRESADAGCV